MLPDPGLLPDPEPPNQASWDESVYTYLPSRPHAVTAVDRPGSDSTTLSYDANGNMTCRFAARQSPHPRCRALHLVNKPRHLPNTHNLQPPPAALLTQHHPYSGAWGGCPPQVIT